jgi:hypothetical protein
MVELSPWEIGGSEFLQDIFVAVENERIQGILGGGRGNSQGVSGIVLKW